MLTRSWITVLASLMLLGNAEFGRADSPITVGDIYPSSEGALIQVSGIKSCQTNVLDERDGFNALYLESSGGLRCSTRDNILDVLTVNELTFEGIGVAAMCTVEGAPVGVTMATFGLTLHLIDFVVRRLPCENPADDQKVKETAKRVVCEVLTKKGFQCDPDKL